MAINILEKIDKMLGELLEARDHSVGNNLKVSVISLYVDILNRVKYFVPYLPERNLNRMLATIKANVANVLNNRQLSIGIHTVAITNIRKEIDALLNDSDLDYKVVDNINYNCLVRAVKDRLSWEMKHPKDLAVTEDLLGLTEMLIVSNEFNEDTIKGLNNVLMKYAIYSAKSRLDSTDRKAIRAAIKQVKESLESPSMKM